MPNLAKPTPAPTQLAPPAETAAQVLAAQAKALVSARFEIAMAQPRSLDSVRERLLRECARPSFAEVAIYHKPVGDGIEGPSIRFAEAALQAMGNLAVDTPAIYDDPEKRILRVTVSDMETNVTHSKDVTIMKRVERRSLAKGQTAIRTRTNSRGNVVFLVEATDDEILNTENALVSKALRTTGLRLVPGWLVDECMTAVRATRQKRDAADPDAARHRLLDAFRVLGVTADDVQEWLGREGEPQPRELEELRSIYTAIKDRETTWREVMDARAGDREPGQPGGPPVSRTEALKEKLRAKATQPPSSPPPADDRTLERQDPASMRGMKVVDAVNGTESFVPAEPPQD